MTGLYPAGLPHSATPGSKDVCSYPGLFAAYHGLLRRTAPRHPPWTLNCLTIFSGFSSVSEIVNEHTLTLSRSKCMSTIFVYKKHVKNFFQFFIINYQLVNLRVDFDEIGGAITIGRCCTTGAEQYSFSYSLYCGPYCANFSSVIG